MADKKKRKRSDPSSSSTIPFKNKVKPDSIIIQTLKTLTETLTSSSSTSKALTLADVDPTLPSTCREVTDQDLSAIQSSIETLVLSLTRSILSGHGFSFSIPSRSSSNHLYVPELDRIVLKDKSSLRPFASVSTVRKATITTRILQLIHQLCLKNIHVTKRDLFYTDVKLFQDQSQSDSVLDDVSCLLGCTRSSLNVIASEKGVVVGRLIFSDNGDMIDCTKMGMGGKAIPPNIDRVGDMQSDALFILLVEKDAAYMRLAEDRFYNRFPCIIVTAKGQPDVATRLFLRKMKMELRLPVLALVDSDPYGLKILSVYGCGSKNMSYDSANLTTPDIKWLGIRPSDLDKYGVPEQCRLPMTEQDIKTGKDLLEEDFVKKNPGWVEELNLMVKSKQKAEIQALSSFGFQYLSEICKYFLEAVERKQYGWFWVLPYGGKECHYRYALPPGYVRKSQMKALLEEETEKIPTEEEIENQATENSEEGQPCALGNDAEVLDEDDELDMDKLNPLEASLSKTTIEIQEPGVIA
ncbi:Spo11/DNA topoisomerase VI, subunit A, N-terminal [Dillenia turbinata]|uniref:DNA topoisomerase 6 subunit A n=1 Tax=Dillenia turbinata TaxID=194707 RepID=A0AAN8ZSB1_9MAGN